MTIIVLRSHYFPDNIACVLRGGGAVIVEVRGYNTRIKDERRQEEGKEDRGSGNKGAGETQKKRKRSCVT